MAKLGHRTSSDGWTYEVYSADTPAKDLGEFKAFKQLWDSKRVGDSLPAWRDFELEDFIPWHGWICVEDLIPGDAYDSTFRLWGIHLTEFYGHDLTNRRMREFENVLFSPEDFENLQSLKGTDNIRICWGPVKWQLKNKWRYSDWYSFIELPMADDGRSVDRLLNLAINKDPSKVRKTANSV